MANKGNLGVHSFQDFYLFIKLLGHGEGMNALFKDCVLPKDRIEKFTKIYEIQKKTIKKDDEDRQQTRAVPSCFPLQPTEKACVQYLHKANIAESTERTTPFYSGQCAGGTKRGCVLIMKFYCTPT